MGDSEIEVSDEVQSTVPASGVEPVIFGDEDGGSEEAEASPESSPERSPHTVPVAVLQRERKARQQLQQQVQALEGELASKKERVEREARTEETASEKTEARERWRQALGVDEQQAKIDALEAKLAELDEGVGYSQRQAEYVESQYYDNVGGFVLEKFYSGNNYPVTENQYAQLYAAEMTPEEHEAVQNHDLSCLEDIAKRVHKGFVRKPQALKEAKDYRRVQELPKVPGTGGSPSPPPEEAPVTGKDLHRKAAAAFEAIRGRR
jgi:hypothetical protein